MRPKIKYLIIFALFSLLLIPIFFGLYIDLLFINEFNLIVVLLFILGYSLLYVIGKFIEIYGYNSEVIVFIKKHDVINSFINNNNELVRWLGFLLIMTVEEIVFRYYLIGLLLYNSNLGNLIIILISSLIFSVYHLHTWFSYKNRRILIVYLIYSFLLGLFTSYLLLTLGIFSCILVHYSLGLILYHGIHKRYFNNSSK